MAKHNRDKQQKTSIKAACQVTATKILIILKDNGRQERQQHLWWLLSRRKSDILALSLTWKECTEKHASIPCIGRYNCWIICMKFNLQLRSFDSSFVDVDEQLIYHCLHHLQHTQQFYWIYSCNRILCMRLINLKDVQSWSKALERRELCGCLRMTSHWVGINKFPGRSMLNWP